MQNATLHSFLPTLFNAIQQGILVVNVQGTIELVNERLAELFGYEMDEVLGKDLNILIPSDLRSSHQKHVYNYFEKPKNRPMGSGLELKGVKKDGSEFPVEVSLSYFQDGKGNKYSIALLSDITERIAITRRLHQLNTELKKKVVESTDDLHKSQTLFQAIARNFPNGTINVFDENLRYKFAEGEEFYRLGISTEKLIGSTYTQWLPDEVAEDMKERLSRVFDKGRPQTFEISLKKGNYQISAVPLFDEVDEPNKQILVVEQNISRQKLAQQEVSNALEKEQQLGELKSRFVSMASHEFRTPLSSILTSANLARRYSSEDQAEKREKHLKRIESAVRNLSSILEDFLSVSKLEEGRLHCKAEWFHIKEFAEDITEELQGIAKKDQKIEMEFKGEDQFYSDPHILRNVSINLLSNAIKYSSEGDNIRYTFNNQTDSLIIQVHDHGIGIPEDEQELLFSRFFRASNAANIQGTGLGLNIVKKYVDLLSGNITFESKKGHTVFTVWMPNLTEK